MSAAKHTPGPWEVRASHATVDFGIIVRDERAKDGWAVIAEAFSEIRHAGERAPEALPNARLMAAAPDYHDATEKVLAEARLLGPTSRAHVGGLLRAINDLRTAHAKATGTDGAQQIVQALRDGEQAARESGVGSTSHG